jgi:putative addiction module killer protein
MWPVIEGRRTAGWMEWFSAMRDRLARSRIYRRVRRVSLGNPGDVRPVGACVSKLQIDYGPGYRGLAEWEPPGSLWVRETGCRLIAGT